MMTVVYLIFGRKTKIAITGVHSKVREPLTKQLSNTLNSVLFPETYFFACKKVLSDNLNNKGPEPLT